MTHAQNPAPETPANCKTCRWSEFGIFCENPSLVPAVRFRAAREDCGKLNKEGQCEHHEQGMHPNWQALWGILIAVLLVSLVTLGIVGLME
jgi:hypothetical protein